MTRIRISCLRECLVVGAILVAGVAHSTSTSGTSSLPTAREVLDRYVVALGGRDAILKHKSSTVRGRIELPERGESYEAVLYAMPFRRLEKIIRPGGEEYVSGFNGQANWKRTEDDSVDLYSSLTVVSSVRSPEVADVTEFAGHTSYRLRGVNGDGRNTELFYDRQTGLLRGYHVPSKCGDAWNEVTETFDDYRDFGGVKVPTRITYTSGSKSSVITISEVTYDDVDPSVFNVPEAHSSVGRMTRRHDFF